MTKDKLMLYTLLALVALAVVTTVMWWGVVAKDAATGNAIGWQYGYAVIGNCLIAVGVAVGLDFLLYKVAEDSKLNIMSAAVFGMIVALSYTIGEPQMRSMDIMPLLAPECFIWVALISMIGLVLFKKIQGLKRKFVNPAAAAKLLVFGFLGLAVLAPSNHTATGPLGVPSLAGAIGYNAPINGNGLAGFGFYLAGCFGNPGSTIPTTVGQNDILSLMFLDKFHSWIGGACSLAVIIAGIVLFVLARKYIKWRITAAYFVTVAIMAVIMNFAYPGGDLMLRLAFELFIGSSIFLAFFMATDPASTPLTYTGQLIFGVGLGVLTVLIQSYMSFFGGSILALVIMNLTTPLLDRLGRGKPTTESKEPKLPKGQAFAAEKVKEYQCMKCGACMRVCCHKLSPILIKEAFDKQDFDAMIKLHADYCTGCGHCTFVCPSRIDLRNSILRAKAMLRQQ
jgi:electron transport complex protein RnfD